MSSEAVQLNKSLMYAYIDHQVENAIDSNLLSILNGLNKNCLFLNTSYMLKELVANAYKANLKRVHFKINNLDINSPDSYRIGIQSFKDNLRNLDSSLFKEAKSLHSYIKIDFNICNNIFSIAVINNTPMIQVEKERMLNKIKNARTMSDFEEVISKVIDKEEGSGLGLMIVLLTLKKIGLNDNAIEIHTSDKTTEIKIKIPLSAAAKLEDEMIADEAVKMIDEIPPFPQHIMDLQKNLSDPNTNFKDLIKTIIKDPPLIAKILKISNSSMYMLTRKINTIEEAVRIIGFDGIKNIVFAYNIENLIMNSKKLKTHTVQDIIQHSLEVAYYAYHMAKNFKYPDSYNELYIAGTLHDIGKIIINSLNPDILDKLSNICKDKGISADRLENISNGLNHAVIGAKIAQKWNFPDYIVDVIKNHHTPLNGAENNKSMLYFIYLGDAMFHYKHKNMDYNRLDYEVLKYFSLTDKYELENLFNRFIKQE